MIKRMFVCLVIIALLFPFSFAQAQQSESIPRIGFLGASNASTNADRIDIFQRGLRELGYVEGKNIFIEYRWAEGKTQRLHDLAADLVRHKVDVIVTAGPTPTRVAKQATTRIPIVMTHDPDPVGSGFVSTLAHPGGNITGLSSLAEEISGKQLELLREIILTPTLQVATLGTSAVPGSKQELKEIERAARAFGVKVQYFDVADATDIVAAFAGANRAHADAILVGTSAVLISHRKQIVDLAAKFRLPTIYIEQEFVLAGGLMAYAASITDLYRRAATYVDKILRGAKPADLPVEQPTKFELVINLKAAKEIGLTIPPNVLARADRVIK